ncbi:MAG: hypothetical protein VB081_08840 [Christensenella sp.]|uniref:hypothetical protein n=1 Tax=Christensenella sp. TaxID=1935934 RepID=UPI002B1EC6C3|nr:hypothetical protein [Christensenella sp.]MEA5003591.1 hypothetical protein [Christensenella sp.]
MSNKKVLECLEKNVDGLEIIQNLMRYDDPLVYSDLMLDIDLHHFEGYEALLPVMLLSTGDPIIERTGKRLLLQLYSEKLQKIGGWQMVDYVKDILLEEQARWEKHIGQLRTLRKQNKI